MKWEKFKSDVINELCECRGSARDEIIAEVEKEIDWLKQFYDDGKKNGDFVHAKRLAVDNFSLWV